MSALRASDPASEGTVCNANSLLLCSISVQRLRGGWRLVRIRAAVVPGRERRPVPLDSWWVPWLHTAPPCTYGCIPPQYFFKVSHTLLLPGEDMTLEGRRQLALFLVRLLSVCSVSSVYSCFSCLVESKATCCVCLISVNSKSNFLPSNKAHFYLMLAYALHNVKKKPP